MKAWLPHPLLTLSLTLAWCLLNSSLHPAHLTLGAAFGVAIPWMLRSVLLPLPRLRQPLAALKLTLQFAVDVVQANLAVARLILGPERKLNPGYLWVPMDSEEPLVMSLLAAMVTMTPGTVAARFTDDQRYLLVHALDAQQPELLIEQIKQRYERPLRSIFEDLG